jgi:hypothetical protein
LQLEAGIKFSTLLSHSLVPFSWVDIVYQPISVSIFIRPLQPAIGQRLAPVQGSLLIAAPLEICNGIYVLVLF